MFKVSESSATTMQTIDLIKSSIIKVLMEDPRTMPLNVLKSKTFREVKSKQPDLFIKDSDFMQAVDSMKQQNLIGENRFGKFFVDYLDYEKSNIFGEGYLEVDKIKGNGFITIKKNQSEFKKSTHFVHKKNLNGAKDGDYVSYVELIITNPRHFNRFSLIDASIIEILKEYKDE